jgi:hypothetical protein
MNTGTKGIKRKRSSMHKLEKLILESYAQVNEETVKPEDLPAAFKTAIEKRHGPLHPKDFFTQDMTRYMKFDGENKRTGQVSHKVIQIPSFDKMYSDYSDIVQDIKVLMRDKDVRTDKAARELFELIKTNFRKLQRYLRTERPDQYALIRNRASIAELHEMFVSHASLIKEERADELKIGRVKNIDIFIKDQSSFTDTMFYILVDTTNGKEYQVGVDVGGEEVDLNYVKEEIPILAKMGFPDGDAIGNFIVKDINKELDEIKVINESMLDEDEEDEEPTPEEEPDTDAPEETVLEDATDKILGKFPTVKAAIIKLQTEQFKEFVESIDWISPRPSSFRINLKNGQDYILKWNGKTFEAQILGKRYLLSNIAEYQQALDKLAILYKEAPMSGAGEGEAADTDTGGGGGGGGEFPGDDAAGGGEEGDAVDDLGGDEGGEEGGADLGGEEIDFEEPGEEPEA